MPSTACGVTQLHTYTHTHTYVFLGRNTIAMRQFSIVSEWFFLVSNITVFAIGWLTRWLVIHELTVGHVRVNIWMVFFFRFIFHLCLSLGCSVAVYFIYFIIALHTMNIKWQSESNSSKYISQSNRSQLTSVKLTNKSALRMNIKIKFTHRILQPELSIFVSVTVCFFQCSMRSHTHTICDMRMSSSFGMQHCFVVYSRFSRNLHFE